jgi:hypothetical protein
MRGMFDGPSALVNAGLRGYRAWGFGRGGELLSTGVEYAWAAGDRLHEATCLGASWAVFGCPCSVCRTVVAERQSGSRHDAPGLNCACGFWGWYEPQDMRIVQGPVRGAVEVSGRVIHRHVANDLEAGRYRHAAFGVAVLSLRQQEREAAS